MFICLYFKGNFEKHEQTIVCTIIIFDTIYIYADLQGSFNTYMRNSEL